MQTYVILRRAGWKTPDALEAAAKRSLEVGDDEMAADIRWIRSYVTAERTGDIGTLCIYEATSPDAIRQHAARAGLPVDEIVPVVDTVVIRPDPAPAAA